MLLRPLLFVAIVLVLTSLLAHGQGVTTGSVTGVVTGKMEAAAQPLSGATVRAVSTSTGAVYGAITKSKGQYLIRGLRPGTYDVSVTYVGFRGDTVRGVNVDVGEATTLNIQLNQSTSTASEVVVTAERDAIFDASRNGSGSVISEATITASPSINRSISDLARMNPYTNQTQTAGSDGLQGVSIMGVNSRFNNFQIDGAVANDVFALGAAGTAGSQANSNFVSLDAIERIRVNVSPYDIRQSGFTGGLVNAITRGGTNQFKGSVFTFGRNQDLVGLSPDAGRRPFDKFYDYQFGGRLGGPIIKDKLLFHVTAEARLRSTPVEVSLNDPTALNNFPVPSQDLDRIIAITRTRYGYDAGGYDITNTRNNTVNMIARLDYNINEAHKLQLRHNFTYGIQDRNLLRNNLNYSLLSRMNTFESMNNQTVVQLNNLLSQELSNELRVSFTQTNDRRVLPADGTGNPIPFPEVRIQVGSGLNVILGPERSSQANALDQTLIALTDDLTWFLGDHTLTIGTHNEFSRFNNLFIQDFFGSYQFPTIDAYEIGQANYYRVSYANDSVTGGNPMPRAAWNMLQLGFYVQDEWQVNSRLRLTGGVRVDAPLYLSTPYENQKFAAAFSGRSTSAVPSGALLFSPRVGFNYDISGDKTWQIRGGTGVFTGRVAAVWLSNQYSNTGIDLFRAELGGNNTQTVITDANKLPVTWDLRVPAPRPGDTAGYPGLPINTAAINITDQNFRLPQVWRTTLATDIKLVQGITFTAEGMYGSFLNQVDYANLNLRRSNLRFVSGGDTLVGVSPLDGRPLYAGGSADSLVDRNFTQVILLRSRSAGYQYSVSGQLRMDEANRVVPGLGVTLMYTYGRTQDLNSSTAATATSQWTSTDAIDPNNVTLGNSSFDMLHRVSVSGSYRISWDKDMWTSIGIFYSGNSGRPYSLSYAEDYNGDNAAGGNDLVYVPKPEDYGTRIVTKPTNDLDFRSPDQIWQQIMAFIDANPMIKRYQGQILPRNVLREPWVNLLDLRILHQIPVFSDQTMQFSLDVQNVLNLLNPGWGLQRFVDFQSANIFGLRLENGKPFDKDGLLQMTYNAPVTNNQPGVYITDNFFSRWRMQLGIRYTF